MARSIKVGDGIQWTNQGVAQFSEPRIVTAIYDYPGTEVFPGGKYALIEGTNTGLPVSELSLFKPNALDNFFSHAVKIWNRYI